LISTEEWLKLEISVSSETKPIIIIQITSLIGKLLTYIAWKFTVFPKFIYLLDHYSFLYLLAKKEK